MNSASPSPASRLRAAAERGPVALPGAFNALAGRAIADAGFEGCYVSGAALSVSAGVPDVGLLTLNEFAAEIRRIADASGLPVVADADTGFGGLEQAVRTVVEYERAGAAGLHVEDQVFPKRCGHLDGKNMVDLDTAVKRIAAAVDARRDPNFLIMARTDLRAVEGLDAAIARMKALVEAGADAIFPEALKDIGEFETVCRELEPLGVPVLANMTEFGKSELFTRRQLADAGVAMVIYPVTLLRSAMGAAERVLDAIKEEGTQQSQVEQMLTRARLYELVDYEGYNAFDTGIFNFDVPTLDIGANHADL